MPEQKSEALDPNSVKPTPTQAENDAAALGEHVANKEPDGSPPDANVEAAQKADKEREEREKQIRARHATAGTTHQTRATQAPQHTPPRPPST